MYKNPVYLSRSEMDMMTEQQKQCFIIYILLISVMRATCLYWHLLSNRNDIKILYIQPLDTNKINGSLGRLQLKYSLHLSRQYSRQACINYSSQHGLERLRHFKRMKFISLSHVSGQLSQALTCNAHEDVSNPLFSNPDVQFKMHKHIKI